MPVPYTVVMLAKVKTGATLGLDGVAIEVEVDVAGRGFPSFNLVGLPNKAVEEAKERVRTAIANTGFDMPDSRITVNLAPADIPKSGAGFDLPIALGILAASGMANREPLKDALFLGELSLEGKVKKVNGVISIALLARQLRFPALYVPSDNAKEAAMVEGVVVYPVYSLGDLVLHLNGQKLIDPFPPVPPEDRGALSDFDFTDVRGQNQAKRALEIAAAGFHNIHLKGVPGSGKTMLSRAFPSIMPPLDREEILEVSKIYSVAGLLGSKGFVTGRPFRSPHHTTSRIGLIGGGSIPAPGEISLAHRGVLFLDELPEFPRAVLESLRQPLEDGYVFVSRAAGSIRFPCRFLLIAASNPCQCGYLGHPRKKCTCMPGAVLKYRKKLSGPLLDRIDLHVDVPPVEEEKLMNVSEAEGSVSIRARVIAARELQKKRFRDLRVKTNAEMSPKDIRRMCKMTGRATLLLRTAIARFCLSARVYFKVLKVARTIADLDCCEAIDAHHIAEALQYRPAEEKHG